MNCIQEVVFQSFEVSVLEEPIRFELLKGVEFVNEPSHDKDEALYFADQLISQINICHLFIILCIQYLFLILLHEIALKFLGTLFENVNDFNFVVESFLCLFGFDVPFVNFSEFFSENLTHYSDRMILFLTLDLFLNQVKDLIL